MSSALLREGLLLLHLLGAVAWVGGMLFAMIILRPALSVLTAPDRLVWLNLALGLVTVGLGTFA